MHRMFRFILVLVLSIVLGTRPAMAVERPFTLTGAGSLEFITDGNGNVTGGTLTASGTATHLGKWKQDGTLSFMPNPNNPTIINANGDSTFTAANGNELQVLFDDTALDTTTGIATGTFLFSGGTGRFEEAQGSAKFEVMQELNSGAFEVSAKGTIDY